MNVFTRLDQLPIFHRAVITVGSFDGVHQGHQVILRELAEYAEKIGGESILITFYPHPRSVLQPQAEFSVLNTFEEKLDNLAKSGLTNMVVIPFDQHFSEMTAEQYVEDFIWKYFSPKAIIIGYDHRFGKGRTGSIDTFRQFQQQYGYELLEIEAAKIEEIAVSSTKIRQALKQGQIDKATELLGYHYPLKGKVVKGNQLGRTLGFPTANIVVDDPFKLVPQQGVYLVHAMIKQGKFNALLNIGYRPTLGGSTQSIEAYLFDFEQEIYGAAIQVVFLQKIRDEQKFESLDALKAQLNRDRQTAEIYFRIK